VNIQTIAIPIKTRKNTPAVHAVALNPTNIFATITADIAMVLRKVRTVKQVPSNKTYGGKLVKVDVVTILAGRGRGVCVKNEEVYDRRLNQVG
jgi:hypothetical protein